MDDSINSKKSFRLFMDRIIEKKKLLSIVWGISFALSAIYIFSIPRYYKCEISLAPELGSTESGNKLSSIASTFGVNFGSSMADDAISPTLYPDLLESTNFLTKLMDVRVKDTKGKIETDYFTYMKYHQKLSPIGYIVVFVADLFKEKVSASNKGIDPYRLTEEEYEVFKKVRSNIKCDVDLKTDLITISVTDQDKEICTTLAENVRIKLQEFITEYRTGKARTDIKYYYKLMREAKAEYSKAKEKYIAASDANRNSVLYRYKVRQEDFEKEMSIKHSTYTALYSQYEGARAKLQERTPAFTVVKNATVPTKPAGPKRLAFIFIVTFLAITCTVTWINRDFIWQKS